MRITLLRHGKPAFELTGNVRAKDLGEIAKSYDLAGITGSPPRETVAAVQGNNVVICSHLGRSLDSAKALGFTQIHLKDPLFRENSIPHFSGGSVTLPINVWVVVLRILWLFGFSRNGESLANAKGRARQAAAQLAKFAAKHKSVLLVGHGFINHFIAKELLANGWMGPSKPGNGFWEHGVYERATT